MNKYFLIVNLLTLQTYIVKFKNPMGVGHKLSCEKGYKFDFWIIYS